VRLSEATAKAYARALFAIAAERSQIEAVGSELASIANVFGADSALANVLARPWVGGAAKRAAVTEVANRLGVSPLVRDFLALVAVRNRTAYLAAIDEAYRKLEDQARGRVRIKLRTATSLTEPERAEMSRRLGAKLGGRQLLIEETVDPTLLGGFVAEVGSMILDGSLDTQLARMRDRLARA
jgi:F-type H+-transporting ATPase subunit delta